MHDRTDPGQDGSRTGQMQNRTDAGGTKTEQDEGRIGRMQDRTDGGQD